MQIRGMEPQPGSDWYGTSDGLAPDPRGTSLSHGVWCAAHKGANFNLCTGVVWNSIPTSVGVVWHHGEEAGHAPGTLWLPLWHAVAHAPSMAR